MRVQLNTWFACSAGVAPGTTTEQPPGFEPNPPGGSKARSTLTSSAWSLKLLPTITVVVPDESGTPGERSTYFGPFIRTTAASWTCTGVGLALEVGVTGAGVAVTVEVGVGVPHPKYGWSGTPKRVQYAHSSPAPVTLTVRLSPGSTQSTCQSRPAVLPLVEINGCGQPGGFESTVTFETGPKNSM